jgi:hypothetical protein
VGDLAVCWSLLPSGSVQFPRLGSVDLGAQVVANAIAGTVDTQAVPVPLLARGGRIKRELLARLSYLTIGDVRNCMSPKSGVTGTTQRAVGVLTLAAISGIQFGFPSLWAPKHRSNHLCAGTRISGPTVLSATLVLGYCAWRARIFNHDGEVDVVMAIVDGEFDIAEPVEERPPIADVTVDGEGSLNEACTGECSNIGEDPCSGGRCELKTRVVESRTARRARKYAGYVSKQPTRIPFLAGVVASKLKIRHGVLEDTTGNRHVIRKDAANRVEALQRDEDPEFKNLRTHDLHCVVLHANEMFWIPSTDEIDVQALYGSTSPLKRLRKLRAGWFAAGAR